MSSLFEIGLGEGQRRKYSRTQHLADCSKNVHSHWDELRSVDRPDSLPSCPLTMMKSVSAFPYPPVGPAWRGTHSFKPRVTTLT
jgi:hypothetical protein